MYDSQKHIVRAKRYRPLTVCDDVLLGSETTVRYLDQKAFVIKVHFTKVKGVMNTKFILMVTSLEGARWGGSGETCFVTKEEDTHILSL